MDWLKQIAPTLVTLLGGPLAGLGYELLGKALGTSPQEAESMLNTGKLTGDQLLAVKQAELDAKAKEAELGFKFAELDVRDRDSARKREAEVKDSVNSILAYSVVGAFIAMVAATLLGYAKVESVLAGTLVGYLSAKCEQVLAYYFGSSASSKAKDATIAGIAKSP